MTGKHPLVGPYTHTPPVVVTWPGALMHSHVCSPARDIAPVGSTLAETNHNLDEISDLALQLQQETGQLQRTAYCILHTALHT